jgi:hypothetical protein
MEPEETAAGVVTGAFAALILSFVLVPVRSSDATAIFALLLVLPVLLGALVGGRLAGAAAAVAATLCFDFFFTKPYGSLKIDRAQDVETVLVLLAVALFAGTVAARGRRSRAAAEEGRLDLEAVQRVAGLVARGAPPEALVAHARRELEQLFALQSADYVENTAFATADRPRGAGLDDVRVHRYQAGGFELPPVVELPARGPFGEHGRFVLHSTPGRSVTAQQTRAAVIIADLVGASLDVHRGAVTPDRLHADRRWS